MMRLSRIGFLLALVIGASITTYLVARQDRQGVRIPLKVEFTSSDPRRELRYVAVNDSVIYTLEITSSGRLFKAYDERGNRIWSVEDKLSSSCGQVFVILPAQNHASMVCDTGEGCGILWVSVGKDGRVSNRHLALSPATRISFYDALSMPYGLYAAGATNEAVAVASFSRQGRSLWTRIEDGMSGYYQHIASDSQGNVVASGDAEGVIGTRIAKYSGSGRMIWSKLISGRDGISTTWLGTGKDNTTLVVVRMHHIVGLKDEAEADRYAKLGSKHVTSSGTGFADESGRDQDYVLLTYDSGGKQVGKKTLSHGARILIEDAQVTRSGEIYIVGNRQKMNRHGFPMKSDGAEIIKCDPRGDIIWSRRIRLPDSCLVKGITVTNNGGIYIYGDSRGYLDKKPASLSRLFIYKVDHN